MSVIAEIIRKEPDGSISFGNYTAKQKQKVEGFSVAGDVYKVKTHNEITKLEKNATLLLETVPGSVIMSLKLSDTGASFLAEGTDSTQITLGLSPDTEYGIFVDGERSVTKSGSSGKLTFSAALSEIPKEIKVEKA